jgi:FkbM family methyltransferase
MPATAIGSAARIEPTDIRWIRKCLLNWPLPRGKGILLRLFASRIQGRDFLMQVEPGVHVPADFSDYMIRDYFARAYDRDPSVKLSRALTSPGDVLFDVGANIGLWAMGAALRAGPSGRVEAFEPVPSTFARLSANVTLNELSTIRCHSRALSDHEGQTTFYAATDGNSGRSSLGRMPGVDLPIDVTLTTLDRFCEQEGITKIDFMKVDVEGAELQVFRGAERILSAKTAPPVLFEIGDRLAALFGGSCREVKRLLESHGYRIYRCRGRTLERVGAEEPSEALEDVFAFQERHLAHPALRALSIV